MVQELLRFSQTNEHRFKHSLVTHEKDKYDGEKGQEGAVDPACRVSKSLNLGEFKKEMRDRMEVLLPVMFNRLGTRPFVPSKIETELVAHGDGAFFKRHIDTLTHPEGRYRIISAVYYFHALPKAFSGGALRLHSLAASGGHDTFVDIVPNRDTLVFFPSFFPHEVLNVQCASGQFRHSRFAINFWVHRA
jgi:Rps23 Pro-64 3,4-dihydroxylase Tpa1-like proline 4-hydroxylase